MYVLLVGESVGRSPKLLGWLNSRGCLCHCAISYCDACDLISRTQFDLVISEYQLADRTAFPLLDLLDGSPATLLFLTVVENGSLWLPMLERGKRCIGAPVLCPNNLTATLDKLSSTEVDSREIETVRSGVGQKSSSA